MRLYRVYLLILVAVTSFSCSHHAVDKKTVAVDSVPLQEARVIQPEKLASGGHLLVVPFTAGVGVAANEDLDRISLQIIRGIADTLEVQGSPFKLLVDADSQEADLVIKGRVTLLDQHKKIKALPGKVRIKSIRVEGSVLGVEDEALLAKFYETSKSNNQNDSFEAMGYRIGVAIGKFLLTSVSRGE